MQESVAHNQPAKVVFQTTSWTVVRLAGAKQTTALEKLCSAYWAPLHAFVRRQAVSREEAEDLTQSFFALLLKGDLFTRAGAGEGRFRSFLLGALKHFLANEWDKQKRLRRGGEYQFISLEELEAQEAVLALSHEETPEQCYERVWAETILQRALQRLRNEYIRQGQAARYEQLKPWLALGGEQTSYAEVAASLGLAETGVRTLISRLRRRLRELVRQQVEATVSNPAEVDAEMQRLLAAMVR